MAVVVRRRNPGPPAPRLRATTSARKSALAPASSKEFGLFLNFARLRGRI
jgi:hypothetical protein